MHYEIKNYKQGYFLAISILAHILLFILSSNSWLKLSNPDTSRQEITVYIEKERFTPKNTEQEHLEAPSSTIVSPSQVHESLIIPKTNKLSDKTTMVEKEIIKRGNDSPVPQPLATPKKSKPEKVQKKELENKPLNKTQQSPPKQNTVKDSQADKGIKDFFLNDTSRIMEHSSSDAPSHGSVNQGSNDTPEASNERIQQFLGEAGNSDYLPNIADGEITMLNAKADRFAVFVRRVALQVFSSLRTSDWTDHPVFQQNVNTNEVLIRAIMDEKGKFISATIIQGSNHRSFDEIVLRSVRKGTWDKNPPPAAKTDQGNIHFLFKSKAWVRHQGGMQTRKFILLGTGLE